MSKLAVTNRRVAILQVKLPAELIRKLMEYLYYTPEQIELREKRKRMHYGIMNARHVFGYYYTFNYKYTCMCICFCEKCGNYRYSNDMEECVECKCNSSNVLESN